MTRLKLIAVLCMPVATTTTQRSTDHPTRMSKYAGSRLNLHGTDLAEPSLQ